MKITESGTYEHAEITESLEIKEGIKAEFPSLTGIGGDVDEYEVKE